MPDIDHLTEDLLNEYLDEALDLHTQAVVEAHLENCSDCQARLSELAMVFTSLDSIPEVPLRHDLSAKVLAALTGPAPLWAGGRWILLLQIFVAAAVIFFSWPLLIQVSGLGRLSPIFPDLSTTASSWIEPLQFALTELSSEFNSFLSAGQDWVAGAPLAQLSDLNLWPWVAVLGLCWLVVNVFLLRPFNQGKINGA